jgi:hypothetical protein
MEDHMAKRVSGNVQRTEEKRIGRRQLIQALGVGGAGIVASRWSKPIVDSVVLPLHAQASAVTGSLYAITGAGEDSTADYPSTLYILNPATGAVVSTVGATGFNHVTGLAFHPSTGVLYGVTSDGSSPSQLITIDPFSGVGTAVGATGLSSVPDITFSPGGVLYAWTENGDDLATIDLTSGVGTVLGDSGIGTARTGLEFDSGGTLYMKNSNTIYVLNPADGTQISSVALSPTGPQNALAFRPGGGFYGLERSGGMILYTINTVTGSAAVVGSNAVTNMSALAFNPFVI